MEVELMFKNNPKVSILVAIYNVEKYLRTCLDSIINQTYNNLEIILVDDGSTDNSGKIADEYSRLDSRIRVIHQKNSGLSAARNSGLDSISGEYISFIDGDDYVDKKYVQLLMESIIKNKSQISCGPYYRVRGGSVFPPSRIKTGCCSGYQFANEYLKNKNHDYDAAWAKMFDMSVIQDLRFPLGKRHEDLNFLFRSYCRANKVSFISEPIYYYLERSDSITRSIDDVDYDYDLVDNAFTVYNEAKKNKRVNKDYALDFLVNKHLSYLYTRIRKKSPAYFERCVKKWFRKNLKSILCSNIGFRNKFFVLLVLYGGFFYKSIFLAIYKIRSAR